MSFLLNPYSFQPLGAGATLTADAGTFTLTGVNASLLRSLRMQAGAGSFTLTGNNVGLSTGIPDLVANAGTFTLTGNAAVLSRALRMAAASGSFALAGNAAALSKTVTLLAEGGSFALSGVSAGFARTLVMAAANGTFTQTGNAATLTYNGTSYGAHRYWRLNISAVGSGLIAAIAELQMYESRFGANVVAGGVGTADSTFDGTHPVTEAFDGNLQDTASTTETSVWASASSALPHWIRYDFGSGVTKAITAIGMHGRVAAGLSNMPTAFTVEYSDDGTSWNTAWSESGLSWSAFEYKRLSQIAVPSYSGSPHGSHSHWRIFMNQPEGSAAVAVTELEFRATPGGADQATGGTAAASSQFSGSFPATNAFDNSGTTFWHNGNGLEYGWLRYDFASPVSVAQIAITARNSGSPVAGPTNIAVQYADSASGPWTTAWSVNGEAAWSLSETRTFTDPNYI